MSTSLHRVDPTVRRTFEYLVQQLRYHFGPIRYSITSTTRTRAEQAALYRKQGAQGLAAPPGRSKHELGRAIDVVFHDFHENFIPGEWWEQLGGRWGGNFKSNDWVHFEDPYPLG